MAESDLPQVISRQPSVEDGILPTGRQVGVVPVRNRAMYQLSYIDGKGGELPDEYKGMFTSLTYAYTALRRFCNDLWDVSDKAAARSKKTISLNQTNAVS